MATRVYSVEDIALQDGTEVTLKPLPIARLRKFMEAWNKIGELPDGDDGFDIYINCCGIGMAEHFEEKYEVEADDEEAEKGEVLGGKYKKYLEGVLDLETIFKIMEVTGGIKLNDPKLVEAALEMTQAASLGKSSN